MVPFLDVCATLDSQAGQAALFILNRDLESKRELSVDWREPSPARVLACQTLTGSDLKAANSFEKPNLVVPQALAPPRAGSRMSFELPPRSYTVVHLAMR